MFFSIKNNFIMYLRIIFTSKFKWQEFRVIVMQIRRSLFYYFRRFRLLSLFLSLPDCWHFVTYYIKDGKTQNFDVE